jgi:hypothetical protein
LAGRYTTISARINIASDADPFFRRESVAADRVVGAPVA